jgi:uncharacterized membrane protein YqjE
MIVKANIQQLILLSGLVVATVGMAFVVFGVVVSVLFFPGVYMLALGLVAAAVGAILGAAGRDHA